MAFLRSGDLSVIRILSGNIYLKNKVNGTITTVSENQLVIKWVSSECEYRIDDTSMAVLYSISSDMFPELSLDMTVLYRNGTDIISITQFEDLISILNRAFTARFQVGHLSASDSLHYAKLICTKLFEHTTENHFELSNKVEYNKSKIKQYIESNYMNPITLESVAAHLGYSNSYFSKYFKTLFGQLFIEYLHDVRMSHIIEDLGSSEKSMADIALANGFNSISAFNTLFKKKYGMTPTAYKKQLTKEKSTPVIVSVDSESENDIHYETKWSVLTSLQTTPKVCTHCWNSVFNLGVAKELLSASVQRQILFLKENFHFTHGRIWSLLSQENMIDPTMKNTNFSVINQILDFLVNANIKPFIVLGFKPKGIVDNPKKGYMFTSKSEQINMNSKTYYDLTRKFLLHCVQRYGKDVVSEWKFEQWWDRPGINGKVTRDWHQIFSQTYSTVHSIVPAAEIGWAAFNIYDQMKSVKDYLLHLASYPEYPRPDFLSVVVYPYMEEDELPVSTLTQGTSFIKDSLLKIIPAMEQAHIPTNRLYITELNVTISNRNYLNDSCVRASAFIQYVSQLMEECGVIAFWSATDLTDIFFDTSRPIFGGSGLITCEEIRKPVFYALQFLNNLGDQLIYHDDHCIVTKNGRDIAILLNNFQPLDDSYSVNTENLLLPEDILDFGVTKRHLPITLTLNDLDNGEYIVITNKMREMHEGLLKNGRRSVRKIIFSQTGKNI